MVDLQAISKFVIISSFITFHAILTSEGRPLKWAWKDEFHSIYNKNQMHKQASRFLAPSQSPRNDDHSEAKKKKVPSPTAHDQGANLSKSEAVYKDDYHPTNPGNSPGGDHSFVGFKDEDIRPKAPGTTEERLTVTGTLGDFGATGPGHSPGVGHGVQSKNDEPKA